jgi:hypothetical protein
MQQTVSKLKAYVTYYGPDPEPKLTGEETEEELEKRRARPPIVIFHKDPLWTLPAKDLADTEQIILQRMRVVGRPTFLRVCSRRFARRQICSCLHDSPRLAC